MENVYDAANVLAQTIRKSKEYNEYKEARARVLTNENLKNKISEFEKIRYDVQMLSIENGAEDPEKMKKLQEMYSILIENKEIKEYFDIEVRFNVMVADVNKIIAESMEDVFNNN